MLCWVVGFVENIVAMKEHDKSMNKSGVRTYPHFFAMNFTVPDDTSKNWFDVRLKLLHEILTKMVFTQK